MLTLTKKTIINPQKLNLTPTKPCNHPHMKENTQTLALSNPKANLNTAHPNDTKNREL